LGISVKIISVCLKYGQKSDFFGSIVTSYCVTAAAAVVILCGEVKFIEDFMLLAEEMDMIDPDEYVYLHIIHNSVDATRVIWSGRKSRVHVSRAFRPVLRVCIFAFSDVTFSFVTVFCDQDHLVTGP